MSLATLTIGSMRLRVARQNHRAKPCFAASRQLGSQTWRDAGLQGAIELAPRDDVSASSEIREQLQCRQVGVGL